MAVLGNISTDIIQNLFLSRFRCALWLCSRTYLQTLFINCFIKVSLFFLTVFENISADIIHQLFYQGVAVYCGCARVHICRHSKIDRKLYQTNETNANLLWRYKGTKKYDCYRVSCLNVDFLTSRPLRLIHPHPLALELWNFFFSAKIWGGWNYNIGSPNFDKDFFRLQYARTRLLWTCSTRDVCCILFFSFHRIFVLKFLRDLWYNIT